MPKKKNRKKTLQKRRKHSKKGKSRSPVTVKDPNTHSLLEQAIFLINQKNLEAAETTCRAALKTSPSDPDALHLLGYVFSQRELHDSAIEFYNKAIKRDPAFYGALNNRGISHNHVGEYALAVKDFEAAIQIDPGNPDTYNNLANAFKALGKLNQAVDNYKKALAINPQHAQALSSLENTSNLMGDYGEGRPYLEQSPVLTPDNSDLFNNLTLRTICDWHEYDQYKRSISEKSQHGSEIQPFYLLPWIDDPEIQLTCAKNYTQQVVLPKVSPVTRPKIAPIPSSEERIKVGYISKDFCNHVVSLLTVELFELHNREKFELYGFALGNDDHSNMRQHLKEAFDHFIEVGDMSDSEVANTIADNGIQILIDLGGYAIETQPQIMAMRPAPLQISYLGYIGTMGADFIDYIIVDEHNVPGHMQPYFTEKLLHLPCYMTHDSKRAVSDTTPTRTEVGLPEEGFVFCCFNNAYKITPDIFDIWMRCLDSVPDSILWLVDECSALQENLRREAQDRGIAPERLIFAPRIDAARHLARLPVADLFLDTLPYNAGATACDALWMGLPVLTCPGNSFVSRMGGSLVHAAGLPELVVNSLDEYEALAIKLAKEPDLLHSLRQRLVNNRETCLLFDNEKFRDNIEQAFINIWDQWCLNHNNQSQVEDSTPSSTVDENQLKVLQQKAVALHQEGNLNQAEATYRKILAIAPQQAEAINLLGVISAQRGKIDDAMKLYRQAIEVNPQLFGAHNNLGVALYNRQQLQEAADCFSRAATISPNAEAYYNLGNCLYGLQRYREAIENYMHTLMINPDHEQARRNMNASQQQLEQ